MANNKFSLVLLHNATAAASRTAAITAMQTAASGKKSSPLVGFYTEGGKEKAVLGIQGLGDILHVINLDQEALDALKAQVDKLDGEVTVDGSVKKQINDAIEALRTEFKSTDKTIKITKADNKGGIDLEANIDGKTIIKDAETGMLSVASSAITVTGKDAIIVNTGETGSEISLKINGDGLSQSANGLKNELTIHKLTATEVTALNDENVKEAYRLQGTGATAVGDVIKVYKDSSLKSVDFVGEDDKSKKGQFLKLVYIKADGKEETVYVDMSTLLAEAEFQNGLQVTDGKVSVKLSTGEESVKYLKLTGTEEGKKSIEVSGIDEAIETAINALDVDDAAVADQYVSTVSETDGKITVTRAALPVKKVMAYQGEDADSTTDHLEVKTDNSVVTVKLKDVASEETLDKVIGAVALKSDGTYSADTENKITSGATSVKDAFKKVADAVDKATVTAGNGIDVDTTGEHTKVSVKLDTTHDTATDGTKNVLEVGENGLYLSGVIDCGTY